MTELVTNPYKYQDEIRDSRYFVGREDIIEEISYRLKLSKAERPHYNNMGISGKKGAGKTSLTYAVEAKAAELGIPAIRIELNKNNEDSELDVFRKIYEQASSIVGGPVEDSYTRLLSDATEKVEVNLKLVRWHLSNSNDNDNKSISEETVKSDLRSIFQSAEEELAIPAFLVILDNAQHISDNEVLLQKLKNIFTGIDGYCLLFCGTEDVFPSIDNTHSSISRVIDEYHVGPFESIKQTEECLRTPLSEEENNDLSAKTVSNIHSLTNGRPYEINLLAFFMYRYYRQGDKDDLSLDPDVIDDAASQIESSNVSVESDTIGKIKGCGNDSLRLLIPLIENPKIPSGWAIQYALLLLFNTTEPTEVNKQKERIAREFSELQTKGLVEKEDGEFSTDFDVYTSSFVKYYSISQGIVEVFPALATSIDDSRIPIKSNFIRNLHYRLFDSLLLGSIEDCHTHYTIPNEFGHHVTFREIVIHSDEVKLDAHTEGPLLPERVLSKNDRYEQFKEVYLCSDEDREEEESDTETYSENQTLVIRCQIDWMDDGYLVTIHSDNEEAKKRVKSRLDSLQFDLEKFGFEILYDNEVSYTYDAFDDYCSENYEEALGKLDAAEEINSEYPMIYYYRSLCYYEMEYYDSAISSVNRAIEKIPEWADARYHKGVLHVEPCVLV